MNLYVGVYVYVERERVGEGIYHVAMDAVEDGRMNAAKSFRKKRKLFQCVHKVINYGDCWPQNADEYVQILVGERHEASHVCVCVCLGVCNS